MSCINFISCTNANVSSKHEVDISIFEKCHHNISFGKIGIHIPLTPAYVSTVFDYSKANSENIKKAISSFNWNKAFENLSIDYTKLYEISLKIIFEKKKKKKKIKCDYCQPPWMNGNIKRQKES